MPAPGDVVLERMVGFGRVLRSAGMEVGPGRLQDALRGLDVVGLARRDDVYHTLRATLVARREEMDAFDAAFAAYWERAPRTRRRRSGSRRRGSNRAPRPRCSAASRTAAAMRARSRRRCSRPRPTSACASATSPT